MFIQSCRWSGRVPISTSTINQHLLALFHVPDCSQTTICVSFFGGLTLAYSLCGEVLDCWSDDAFACCCSDVRVVRYTCLADPAFAPTASLAPCTRKRRGPPRGGCPRASLLVVLDQLLVHCASVRLLSKADRAHLGKIDFEVRNTSCFLLFALGTPMSKLGSEHHKR